VLDSAPEVRVTFNSETGQQTDAVLVGLAQRVVCCATHGSHDTALLDVPTGRDHVKNLSVGRGRRSSRLKATQ
jgi:hypothetical protein